MSDPDVRAVTAAHTGLYRAVETGDLDLMGAVWVDGPDAATAVCVHPGGTPVTGRPGVLRSWAALMAATPYIQYVLTDLEVGLRGDTAVVSCVENVLTAADPPAPGSGGPEHAFVGGRAVATTVFRRTAGGWRAWVHHASPVVDAPDPFARGRGEGRAGEQDEHDDEHDEGGA
ncbi:nuclear transport factor 2 family protein [Vallicoccus soli]|uniref:DUF4440 domain-containing protein n=1 Tax=Vallicoccus soli TaxID=2339232 RepID=A0A3A3YZ54_9ACTN|nr:nuclear transport factor 2 family protein [Vallicoccus soli]RJK96030.1 DUF4440 domain-containing protein [Vallicoccus soli]